MTPAVVCFLSLIITCDPKRQANLTSNCLSKTGIALRRMRVRTHIHMYVHMSKYVSVRSLSSLPVVITACTSRQIFPTLAPWARLALAFAAVTHSYRLCCIAGNDVVLVPAIFGTLFHGVVVVAGGTENDTNYETCVNKVSFSAVGQIYIALTPSHRRL